MEFRSVKLQGTRRQISTRINAELLVGYYIYNLAYAELMRFRPEVEAYRTQHKDELGYEETG